MDAFLGDPRIEIIGYQAHFEELKLGIFLFNHICKATLAIQVDKFKHLSRFSYTICPEHPFGPVAHRFFACASMFLLMAKPIPV